MWVLAGCAAAPEVPSDGAMGLFDRDAAYGRRPIPSLAPWDPASFPNPDGVPFVDTLKGAVVGLGPARSGAIVLPLDRAVDLAPVGVHASLEDDAGAFLVDVDPDSPERGRRVPVDAVYRGGDVYGAEHAVVLLPLQGWPLRPGTLYAAGVRADAVGGVVPPWLHALATGAPEGWPADEVVRWKQALAQLPAREFAAVTVFETGDPTADLVERVPATPAAVWVDDPVPLETHDGFCVHEGRVRMPVFQEVTPPYTGGGGGFADTVQRDEDARLFVTVPEGATGTLPAVVFVRTGGGGDRPLIDRGPRTEPGVDVPGTGYAGVFAEAGYVGIQVDGPLGGLRNPTGGDEQFLVFNVANPVAMRDNLRQSALELALLPDLLTGASLVGCDGQPIALAPDLVLFGHSMGATIAPVAASLTDAYDALVLSGAGGSWIHNVVSKEKPLAVRPIAAGIVGVPEASLDPFHPVLSLLQWAGEAADPPLVGAELRDRDVLMLQGLVDRYILPDIANATSLSLGLDLAGPPLDADAVPTMRGLEELLPLAGRQRLPLPVRGNQDGRTAVVVQHAEDGVEDGHEVAFQLEVARAQVLGFLTSRLDGEPEVR
jgi:hypothetical protein